MTWWECIWRHSTAGSRSDWYQAQQRAYFEARSRVYARQGALVARRLDAERGELIGDPMTLADKVGYDPTFNLGAFSTSDDHRIAYRTATAGSQQLTWHDRAGRRIAVVGEPDSTGLLYPELSPDDQQLAVTRTVQNNTDIWLRDLVRGGWTPVTTDQAVDNSTVWSPDGSYIVFSSTRSSKAGRQPLHHTSRRRRVAGPAARDAEFRSAGLVEGRIALFRDWRQDGPRLVAYDLAAKKASPLANSRFEGESWRSSPPMGDGWRLTTNESGQFEVVAQAFPNAQRRWTVSTRGGRDPRWRADARSDDIAPTGSRSSASVTTSGATFQSGAPVALFPLRVAGGASNSFRPVRRRGDGRFLVNQLVDESATPITLVLELAAA